MDEKRIHLLSKAPVSKAIFTMSIPMVMGMMIQLLYNLVDIYFICKLEDPNQLAAANITTALFVIMMAISGIIGTGASSYISRCMGKSDYEKASKVLSSGITICFCIGIVFTIIGSIFITPIVNALAYLIFHSSTRCHFTRKLYTAWAYVVTSCVRCANDWFSDGAGYGQGKSLSSDFSFEARIILYSDTNFI